MPGFDIEAHKFIKIIKYGDLISGSENNDPGLYLFFDNGLQSYVSDGCLKTFFRINVEVESFDKTYRLPLPEMKLFLGKKNSSKKENSEGHKIHVELRSSEIALIMENEILALIQLEDTPVQKSSEFEIIGKFDFSPFLKGLDFASVVMPENDSIFAFTRDGLLNFMSLNDNFFTLYNSNKPCENLGLKIPYSNLRHAVKAYSLLTPSQVSLGINRLTSELFFSSVGVVSSLFGKKLDHQEEIYLLKLMTLYDILEPMAVVEGSKFKEDLSKTIKIAEGYPLKLSFSGNQIQFSVQRKQMYYSVKQNVINNSGDLEMSFPYSFFSKKLKSALSKLTSKNLHIFRFMDFIGFGDEEKTRISVFKAQNIERGWNDVPVERASTGT